MLNREKLYRSLTKLDIFMDRSLKLIPKSSTLSGFHYNREMLRAAAMNTYLETVGTRADSIHMAIKSVQPSDVYWEQLKSVQAFSERVQFGSMDAILAFDYTDEDFYGKPEDAWIHSWTGEDAVEGKFRFLTCYLVGANAPLLSIPVSVFGSKSRDVCFMFSLVRTLFRSISLCLFDRGFYSKALMSALDEIHCPYLIFVPKNSRIKNELGPMKEGDRRTVNYEFEFSSDKTIVRGETTLALLRSIADRRGVFDWCFATNQQSIDLDGIIDTYRQRWNIETGFRVQDEATIKSKSKEVAVRFFLFAYEQELQLIWSLLYRQEASFKRFLIELSDMCTERVDRAEAKTQGTSRQQRVQAG